MDADRSRFVALILTVILVVTLTGLLTWGVLHKINKKVVEPYGPTVVDYAAVPATTKEK